MRPAAAVGAGRACSHLPVSLQQMLQLHAAAWLTPLGTCNIHPSPLTVYSAYTVAEVEYERRDEGFFQLGS